MADEKPFANFEKLDELLEAEREILLAGDLEKLVEMLPRKEALIDTLNHGELRGGETLTRLDGKIRRNQLLLDSAMEGIRTVSRRLAALRRVRSSLETYDSKGRKQQIEIGAGNSVEKRA
jgi:hypothetical protein